MVVVVVVVTAVIARVVQHVMMMFVVVLGGVRGGARVARLARDGRCVGRVEQIDRVGSVHLRTRGSHASLRHLADDEDVGGERLRRDTHRARGERHGERGGDESRARRPTHRARVDARRRATHVDARRSRPGCNDALGAARARLRTRRVSRHPTFAHARRDSSLLRGASRTLARTRDAHASLHDGVRERASRESRSGDGGFGGDVVRGVERRPMGWSVLGRGR